MSRLRIAMVYDAVYPYMRGGGEVHVRGLAERLADRGHDVHLVGMRLWDGPAVRKEGALTLHGVTPARAFYGDDGKRRTLPAIEFAAGVSRLLGAERFDVVDCCAFPFFPALALGLLGGLGRFRSPWTLTWFEVWDRYFVEYLGFKGHLARGIERSVARACRHHVCISPFTAERLQRMVSPGSVVRVIPSAVEVPAIEAPVERHLMVWAGRALEHKNLPLLLRAMVHLAPVWRLEVVADGPELGRWKELARSLGLEGRVLFRGALPTTDEVYQTLARAHVVVQTSYREGQGRVGLEALSLGRPFVCVEHPEVATSSFVEHERSALLVPHEQPRALAEAIERIGASEELERTLRAGGAQVAASVSWSAILPAVEAHYADVMAHAQPHGTSGA